MDLGSRGYFYTLLTTVIIVTVISFIYFYIQLYENTGDAKLYQMRLSGLKKHVDAVKSDYRRALSISVQRAALYTVNKVIEEWDFINPAYSMDGSGCEGTEFIHTGDGVQALLAELAVCGTVSGSPSDPTKYMENHTVTYWIKKTENRSEQLGYDMNITLKNLSISMYDATHLLVSTRFDIEAMGGMEGRFSERNKQINTIVSIEGIEDPYYILKTGGTAVTRPIKECGLSEPTDSDALKEMIGRGCYFPSPTPHNGPSFFDRLEGSKTLTGKYAAQTFLMSEELMIDNNPIGLEGLVDEEELQDVKEDTYNRSAVDYIYFDDNSPDPAFCRVEDITNDAYWLDVDHVLDYNIEDVACSIIVSDESGPLQTNLAGTTFALPRGADLEFVNDLAGSETLTITPVPNDLAQIIVNKGSPKRYGSIQTSHRFDIRDNRPTPRLTFVIAIIEE